MKATTRKEPDATAMTAKARERTGEPNVDGRAELKSLRRQVQDPALLSLGPLPIRTTQLVRHPVVCEYWCCRFLVSLEGALWQQNRLLVLM